MYKLFINAFPLAAILVSGLVSCSSERSQAPDVYRPSAPLIRTSGQKSMLSQQARDVDLADTVDLSSAAPARLAVHTVCHWNSTREEADVQFSRTNSVRFFEIVPEEALIVDSKSVPVVCDFDLNLYNQNGSNHIFALRALTVHHTGPADVHLRDANDNPVTRIRLSQASTVLARFSGSGLVTLQIACEDARFPPADLDQAVSLDHVDFQSPEKREGRPADFLLRQPLQTCVPIVLAQGRRVALGDRFTLEFPQPALKVRALDGPLACPTCGIPLINAAPLVLQHYELGNPCGITRFVGIPKNQFAATIGGAITQIMGNNVNALWEGPSHVLHLESSAATVHEDSMNRIVAIPAYGKIDVQLVAQVPYKAVVVPTLVVEPLEVPFVIEVEDTGQEMGRLNIPLSGPANLSPIDLKTIATLTRHSQVPPIWP